MRRHLFGSVLIVALAACSSPEEVSALVEANADSANGAASASATSGNEKTAETTFGTGEDANAKAVDFKDNEKSGEAERDFAYAWPKQASAIPALSELLSSMRGKALAEQKTEWKQSVAEFADQGCVSCVMRDYNASWQVVADTPRFLSLSFGVYVYSGGAHGNSGFDAMIWDREANVSMDTRKLFSSDDALWSVTKDAYCVALDKARAEKRGRPVQPDDFGSKCPSLDDLTLLAGSSNGKTFDRLGFIAAPYIAGPYVEGDYEVTIPVTNAIRDAVKPEYREYFSAS